MLAQEEVQAFGKEHNKKQFTGVRSKAKTSMLNYIWCNSMHKHSKTTEEKKKKDEKIIPY